VKKYLAAGIKFGKKTLRKKSTVTVPTLAQYKEAKAANKLNELKMCSISAIKNQEDNAEMAESE